MNNKHPELICKVCGCIPDDNDIQFTHYHLSKCSKCGTEACDLCSGYNIKDLKNMFTSPKCFICLGKEPIGDKRKYWLQKEYK